MNINKYTEKAQEAIVAAQQIADREGNPEILPEHLLLTLLEQRESIVPEIARKMNADPAALAAAVKAELDRQPHAHGGSQPGVAARLPKVTDPAESQGGPLEERIRSATNNLFIPDRGGEGAKSPVGPPCWEQRGHQTRMANLGGAKNPGSRRVRNAVTQARNPGEDP